MSSSSTPIGRYAPSPTGDLHFGNLRTALVCWLHARLQDGKFLLRMEDIDTPRVVVGSADKILRDLEWLGLDWDGKIEVQSENLLAYHQALELLAEQKLTYRCFCSRKDIQQAASAPHAYMALYPGTCRHLSDQECLEKSKVKQPALRLKVSGELASQCGDFVVRRADKLVAYQLAVVVDDIAQGVTQVVRGADLIDSTPRQLYLAQLLAPNSTPIEYFHVPLMLDESGKRMAKRDGSRSVDQWRAQGRSAPELVGFLAHSLGLAASAEPIDAQQLLAELAPSDVAKIYVSPCT